MESLASLNDSLIKAASRWTGGEFWGLIKLDECILYSRPVRFVFNQIVLHQRIFYISYHSRFFLTESSIAEVCIEESCPLVLCISHKESSIYTERACKLHDMKMTQHGHGLLHKGFNISLLHTISIKVI